MKHKIMRKVLVYGISLLVAGAVAGGLLAWKENRERKKEEASYEEARPVMTEEEMEALYDAHKKERQGVTEGEEKETSEETPGNETPEGEKTVYEGCPVDFEGLWEINKDVYAWITVPGTGIDYPILQHATDNTYYLNYNIDGSYGYPGCIYTENLNRKDFTDNNTVIYGHNMKNGSMFAALHKFEDETFFKEHEKVYIYTPERELVYTIFGAYIYDDRHLLYSFDFANPQVYETYLEDIRSMRSMNALFREGVEVTAEDKIITLVTCIGNRPENRLLVQAVLEEPEGD